MVMKFNTTANYNYSFNYSVIAAESEKQSISVVTTIAS